MARPNLALLLTLLDDAWYLAEWAECVRQIGPDEVLVADGGSKDGGPEFLAEQDLPEFRLFRRCMEEFGWMRCDQMNFAAAQARSDWILMLDADEVLWPPKRRLIEAAMRRAPPAVISLWPARFHLWPDEQTRLTGAPILTRNRVSGTGARASVGPERCTSNRPFGARFSVTSTATPN